MDSVDVTPKKMGSLLVTATISVLLLGPVAAGAQDDESITALRRAGKTFAAIFEKASPAVVVLTADRDAPKERSEPGRSLEFELEGKRPGRSYERSDERRPARIEPPDLRAGRLMMRQRTTGLGFIVSADGYILTNNHVVDGARSVRAELADGRQFDVRVVGADAATDIAVVRIEARKLPVLEMGDSNALKVGDWVVGIGNALGMGRTFSAGLVTAKRRQLGIASIEDFVQTSINMHVGDGGGPLLDLEGKVVGINTAFVGRERGTGISLAIPVNMAKSAYEQIVKTGRVERGFLGVAFVDIDAKLTKDLRLETTSGVLVNEVVSDSAASRAGIRKYDIVVEFDSIPIETGQQLLHLVASLRPGSEVEVVVIRSGERRTLKVTLGRRPSGQPNVRTDTEGEQ